MSEKTETIRRQSLRLRRMVTVLWAIAALLVMLERFSAAGIGVVTTGYSGQALRRLASQGVAAVPEVLFLVGLWGVRVALTAFSRGDLFGPAIARMLDHVGSFLAVGALVRVMIVPGICQVLGFGEGYWIAFDASAMVLGAVGLSMKAIAQVLHQASAVQAELDEIF